MAIHRITTVWRGFEGAPGYSNFFFTGDGSGGAAADSRARVLAFWNELTLLIPGTVSLLTEGEAAVIDEVTGSVTGYEVAATEPVAGNGGGTGGYSAASGAVVTWMTAGVVNGRRVRGRTFLVPLVGNSYENDGSLTSSAVTTLNDAASELVGTGFDSGFGVWSRPGTSGGGTFWEVNGFRVPDMAAVLRSRRD